MTEKIVLPESGMISLEYLSEMTMIDIDILTQNLSKQGVPFLKLSGRRKNWYVNFRKLDAISFGGSASKEVDA
jgi:hypothetical protein